MKQNLLLVLPSTLKEMEAGIMIFEIKTHTWGMTGFYDWFVTKYVIFI